MLVEVHLSQIRRFTANIVHQKGKITGTKDAVLLAVWFPEYLELMTYGSSIGFPITVQKVKDVIKAAV